MSYVEVHNKCKDKTSVWYYFLQRADKLKAKCKLCPGPVEREIATAGSSTSGLVKHLLAIHKIALKSPGSAVSPLASTSQEPPAKKRQTIQDFFQPAKPTMAVRITRLVAVDGIAMRVVVTSQDLRAGLAALHSLPPKHPATIRKTILDHVEELRLSMRACFETLKAKGVRFSLTIDEWTSSANRRYLNVTLCSPVELPNGSVMCNLGLTRLTGSVTAEVCLEALKEKLLQFGLSLNSDILGCASDGAAVMVKLGKLMEGAIGQLCFAHAIHNGICEVLYKKRPSPTQTEEPSLEGVSVNEDVEDDENDAFVVNLQPVAQSEGTADLNEEFYDVISKVRKVVKQFKKSPTSNEKFLQKYVLEEHKNDLALQLDCKTRWNSLCTMVERFVLLASCVKKALIDMRLTLSFTDSELRDLEKLVDFLKPALLSVEALCRRDANLLTADAALEFLFKKLDASESSFGIRLCVELRSRIGKRRSSISTLLQVLHSASYDFKIEDQLEVPRPSNAALKRLTITLLQRLFETPAELEADEAEKDSTGNEVDDPQPIQPVTLEMELEQALSVARTSKVQGTSESSSNFEAILSKEWNLHQSGGGRGRLLDKLYKSLLGIPPTSVESERAFSAAGTIVRPLRTRLGDNMVDALSFARFHYTIKK